MPIHNSDVTAILSELADLLEIDRAEAFRVRAYRNATRTIESLPRNLAEMVEQEEDLSELPGIGKSMAEKIKEIVRTGHLRQLDKLERKLPRELSDLMTLPGLGPKRVRTIYEQLGVETREELTAAAREGKLHELEGLGKKTEKKILDELEKRRNGGKRFRLVEVEETVEELLACLRGVEGVKRAVAAGSYRRRKETVGDLDVLVTCKTDSPVMDRFAAYEDVEEVISKGTTRSTVRLRSGLQVDLRVVAEVSYGAALYYFTGSKGHNIAVRNIGLGRRLKINEYGVFRGEKRIAGRTEEEVFKQVGLPYIEPEMREDQGEIDVAKKGKLPKLIERDDIRGDLHCHTTATDGKASLEEMTEAAKERGYDYLAITDHSKRLAVAKGLDAKRLRRQMAQIDKLNDHLSGIRILKGIECDILDDGSLDLDDEVLADLDVVVCSIHSKFNLSMEKQTERVLRAMDNPHFNILAHPTGRMIGQREPYEIDLERVMQAALERGCFLELNAQPDRLDLKDTYCRMAKEISLKLAVSTDSHSADNLDYIRFGIDQARRGWLEADDVINTRKWSELKNMLKRR